MRSSYSNYEVTTKGQLFLQTYTETSQKYFESAKIIDQLTIERDKSTGTFLNTNKKTRPIQILKPEPIVEFQVKNLKSDLQRIDAKKYYDELVTFGFKAWKQKK